MLSMRKSSGRRGVSTRRLIKMEDLRERLEEEQDGKQQKEEKKKLKEWKEERENRWKRKGMGRTRIREGKMSKKEMMEEEEDELEKRRKVGREGKR